MWLMRDFGMYPILLKHLQTPMLMYPTELEFYILVYIYTWTMPATKVLLSLHIICKDAKKVQVSLPIL